ncbi:MAG: phosphate ABC transporter permease subunit PstC, partial [Pseudomonadota bacterium]|nr:phosphate ABC transporter permease subunit PstC [Pseudomonadota bacterium]
MTTLTRRVFVDSCGKAVIQIVTWAAIALFLALFLTLAGKSLPVLGEHSAVSILFSGEWSPEAEAFGFLPA